MGNLRYQDAVIKYEDHGVFLEITAEVDPANKDCSVGVVYTTDEWLTQHSKTGSFLKNTKHGKSLYRISIATDDLPKQTRMLFALKLVDYKHQREEKWDNNNGWNYEIFPDKLPQICLPKNATR